MKNLFFIFIVFFSFACSPEKEANPGGESAQSFNEVKPSEVNFDNIAYSDEKIVYFSSNWENKSGSEAFNKLIKPLIQKGVDVILNFVTVYESDEKIMEASMCLDSAEKQYEYRSNALASYDAWSSLEGDVISLESLLGLAAEEDKSSLASCLDSGINVNDAKLERETIVNGIVRGNDLEISTSHGLIRTRMLPFLMVGPYMLGSNIDTAQVLDLLDSFDNSSEVKRSKIIVIEGDCDGCRVQNFVNKIAGAFGVEYIEWRVSGDPVGDQYLEAYDSDVLPLIMLENVSVPRNVEEFIERHGSFSILSGTLYEGVYKMKGLDKIEGGHLEGSPDAPTLHVFEDFECPGCAAFNIREYPALKKTFIDTGLISHSFHHYPLPMHQNAYEAAIASECAYEQGKFWEYKDKLFANQKSLSGSDLVRYATEIGLNIEKFRSCKNGTKAKDRVNRDKEVGQSLSLPGTPAFIFPPYKLDSGSLGYLPFLIDLASEEK